MKSKLFLLGCAVVLTSLPLPALAQASFDYKGGSKNYQALPGDPRDRTLPKIFDFPVVTRVATDTTITSDHLITDQFRLPTVPQGLSAADVPRLRSEYTTALTAWGESVRECLRRQPRLIRVSTNNPVLINGKEGTIVRNANNRAVCK
ncbi:MAG: hypothetical protein ACM37W_10300 [Actinomycetota bacterium]